MKITASHPAPAHGSAVASPRGSWRLGRRPAAPPPVRPRPTRRPAYGIAYSRGRTAWRAAALSGNASQWTIRPTQNVHTCAHCRSNGAPLPRPRPLSRTTTTTRDPASMSSRVRRQSRILKTTRSSNSAQNALALSIHAAQARRSLRHRPPSIARGAGAALTGSLPSPLRFGAGAVVFRLNQFSLFAADVAAPSEKRRGSLVQRGRA